MNKTLHFFIIFCLAAGLHVRSQNGAAEYHRYNGQKESQTNRSRHTGGRQPQEEQTERTLDSRKPSDKLELKRPMYRRFMKDTQQNDVPQTNTTQIEPETNVNAAGIKLPTAPTNGPGNPDAPPLTRQYPPMPDGKRVIECRFCHYIYYTSFLPQSGPCEIDGQLHEWHVIGQKGPVCYRCINCNTIVCCSSTPLRTRCGPAAFHVWEIVGQLPSLQEKRP